MSCCHFGVKTIWIFLFVLFRPDFRNEPNEMNQRCSLSTHDHDSVNVIRQLIQYTAVTLLEYFTMDVIRQPDLRVKGSL